MMGMNKIYYQLILKQISPLRIGTGGGTDTDNDVLTDRRGFPFIPGSSLAGVLRAGMAEQNTEAANDLFGNFDEQMKESRILVSDATLPVGTSDKDVRISRRDGIGLDEWGIHVNGSKYDFQVAETKSCYTAVLELDAAKEDAAALCLQSLMSKIAADGLGLGARTTRGYGRFEVKVRRKVFSFPEELSYWLEFDPFSESAFSLEDENWLCSCMESTEGQSSDLMRIHANFKLVDGMNIRVKVSSFEHEADNVQPDNETLRNIDKKAVIPGTAWAGAFRHHMHKLIRDCHMENMEICDRTVDSLFGKAENNDKKRSAIRFSETQIEGGSAKKATRNAVDRVTQAPRNAGLYTVSYWNGGKGVLVIEIERSKLSEFDRELIAATLIDLHLGILSVGGEGGVGRGRIQMEKVTVDGRDVTEDFLSLKTDFMEVCE